MFPKTSVTKLALSLSTMVCTMVAGCLAESDPKTVPPAGPMMPGPSGPTGGPGAGPTVVASSIARVRFKGGERYASDLAEALELPRSELCKELGRYDCVQDIHRITLGGVSPYELGIYDPLPRTGLTTPIAIDRVALSACDARVARDLAYPTEALIFRGLAIDGRGALTNSGSAELGEVASRLFSRLLSRKAQPEEVDRIRAFSEEVSAAGSSQGARDWAVASCYAVATMAEALFY